MVRQCDSRTAKLYECVLVVGNAHAPCHVPCLGHAFSATHVAWQLVWYRYSILSY